MTNFSTQKTYALLNTPMNKKLIADLEKRGAKVFKFPPLETEKINADADFIKAIKNPARFDWIIFPDVFSVDYFLQTLEENGTDFYELDDLRVCAFGEAVSDRLRFSQLHADVVPNSIETKNVYRELTDYIGGDKLSELNFLFLKENLSKYDLINKLKGAGAAISEFAVYRINTSGGTDLTKLKILLEGGAVDEFIFSAAEDVFALYYYFSGEIEDLKKELKTSAVGETVFQTLKEYGFKARLYLSAKENQM